MLIATDEAGRVAKRPSKPAIGRLLANLQRGNAHLLLERVEEGAEGSWYVQVLLRDDNTYQLEFRDGVAAEHFQTRTISQEKVLTAMLGWVAGASEWKHGFMWNNIGSQFDDRLLVRVTRTEVRVTRTSQPHELAVSQLRCS